MPKKQINLASVIGIQEISNQAAEIIAGGFRFANFDVNNNIVSSGTVGVINQRIRGSIANNVDSTFLGSGDFNGSFRIEVPSLGFDEVFFPNEPDGVYIDREDLPAGLDANTEIFITDLGLGSCSPSGNSTCGRRPNNSGAMRTIVSLISPVS